MRRPLPLFDGLALGASFACLVHCLALPVIILALPALAALLDIPEGFHLWMLLFAIPSSLIAVLLGYRRHRNGTPSLLAVIGLSLMALGLFAADSSFQEVALTVAGGLTVAAAHIRNWRMRHSRALSL